MVNLASVDLPTALRNGATMLEGLRVLLAHIDRCKSLPYQRVFRHVTKYLIGEMEECRPAALQLNVTALARATRSLFEASFLVDYLCASDQNIQRFIGDCAIDDLEIMEKFLAIDQRSQDYAPDRKSTERANRLKQKVASLGLTGKKPLQAFEIATAVNREAEYRGLYKVYSKLTHATAWAILGGSEEPVSWHSLGRFLLLRANHYAAMCFLRLAIHTGLPPDTPATRLDP